MKMNSIIDGISCPEDVKKLSTKEMKILSKEIRTFLIESISKTGGHLASNLGVVELTIALHHVFDFPQDKLIWDVGHQSYTHKILTGRKDKMSTLRQLNGMSGFPKREESEYDCFDTGHSSTSISAAVGMARARDLRKGSNEVIAVIGDGALTGGMAFEALNDVGRNHSKMIVILNDNEMSISENVGGLSRHLSNIRTMPAYLTTKKDIEMFVSRIPFAGRGIHKVLSRAKGGIKKFLVPNMLFEELGLKYLGPVDGHDTEALIKVMKRARRETQPVIIHVRTKKGKGYKPAEDRPNDFHGVSSFDIKTGKSIKMGSKPTYSDVFGDKMCKIASKNKNLALISAAMIDGTGLSNFEKKYPDMIFDAGIAEQHAVTMAAGMAADGITPVVALYSSFLQRAYDQVLHDVATQNLHVVFALDRSGLVGNDGETHQGVFDAAFLSQIPNMTVMAPCDYREFENMLEFAVNEYKGPVAVRYPRGGSSANISGSEEVIVRGKGVIVEPGRDISIIASGKMLTTAVEVKERLSEKGIDAEVVNLRFIKPLDEELIKKTAAKTGKVVIIDEAPVDGSFAFKAISMMPPNTKTLVKTLPDEFIRHGSVEELLKLNKMDAESIASEVIDKFYRGYHNQEKIS
ncbi:1-deoxy-D-xylulose-5-phosphate synthase [Proteocatella sphenisci]|uniref:1-deoxy-D-xylulose-5-phosphate synthase n=1 Tax=Proteocatella sphenisci TaxID=181070 RepID=UPI0004B58B4F|nr:1-deoxy-D-xylulose-5-phosphate synthase [Proteocatella sphenisci]